MLLWHGSRLTNWAGILSQGNMFLFSRSVYCFLLFLGDFNGMVKWTTMRHQPGLRIAPPEAPVTGYMFGKGVYFADMFSKSANYCYANSGANDGVLLLCEVYSLLLNCSFHMENNKTLISLSTWPLCQQIPFIFPNDQNFSRLLWETWMNSYIQIIMQIIYPRGS